VSKSNIRRRQTSLNKNNKSQPQIIQQEEHYSGIVPPPEMLKAYDEEFPGFAERLMLIAEYTVHSEIALKNKEIAMHEVALRNQELAIIAKQSEDAHRREEEKQEHSDYRLGIASAITIALMFIVLALAAILNNMPWVATGIIGALAGIIIAVKKNGK
jgi:uncharacterized membrane protein